MKKNRMLTKNDEYGFTLIELSIVLVIIGLIIGGVLVGQDLIKAAEIRATISQVEKYNTAVNTFRTKYNGIPGDLQATQAAAYGLFAETTLGGTTGHGDGNGLIEGGSSTATVPLGETLTFWRQLTDANLIDGAFGNTATTSALDPTTGATAGAVANPAQSVPPAKVGRGLYFVAYAVSGYDYYQLLPVTGIASNAYTLGSSGMTPIESHNIDAKLDDGSPNTGIVQAKALTPLNTAATVNATAIAGHCTVGSGINSDTYDLNASSGGTDASCSLQFRFN